MNKDLQNLIKISKIDKEASTKEPQILAIEEELNIKIKELNQLESSLETLKENIKKAKLNIANNELLITENNEKIAQIDKKMATAKSEREMKALDAENGLAKEKITFANETIAQLEQEIENIKEKEAQNLKEKESLKAEVKTIKESVEKRTAVIKEELKTIFDNKNKIAKDIDNKIIIFYEKIRKWAKDTSIVPIKKQACSGCNIKINNRVFSELSKSETIITCPHCGRILFIE